jgi:protein SCO1
MKSSTLVSQHIWRSKQAGLADRQIFLIIFLLAVAAAFGLWLGQRVFIGGDDAHMSAIPESTHATRAFDPHSFKSLLVYPAAKVIAPFNLTRSDGTSFGLPQLQGRWTLLSFGFTSCPDICPTTLTELGAVLGILKLPSLSASRAQIAFVSIDPERDTPEILDSYVVHYHSEFIAATGSLPALTGFATNLGAVFEKDSNGPGAQDYTMAHTASIFLINPQGQLAAIARPLEQSVFDWPQLRADIPAYLTEQLKLSGGTR